VHTVPTVLTVLLGLVTMTGQGLVACTVLYMYSVQLVYRPPKDSVEPPCTVYKCTCYPISLPSL